MPGTFSQLYVQILVAVKGRNSLIQAFWEEELYKYITGAVQKKEQKMLAINGVADHIHLFIGLKPSCSISDLVREIKRSSTDFIKQKGFTKYQFLWQEGYGAFSYSHSQIGAVVAYVMNQKEHHKKKTFKDEYIGFLKAFDISFDKKYLFEWFEE